MALSLRLRSGDVDPEPELPFDAARVVIGRAPGCDLQLPDPSVSQRHATIRQRGSDYMVVDEGSENGTFAGRARLPRHAPHKLANGDLLRFGRVWVEVRLGPAEQPVEVQASRELARRLVDAALEADGKPRGMTVTAEGTDLSVSLLEPRRPYLVGSKKGSDLKLTAAPDVPSRSLELRRQADQLWVTLQKGASAVLGEGPLVEGQRTAWPKGTILSIGDTRLVLSDPTAQMLERLEREATERLAEDAPIDAPSGSDESDEDDADAESEDDSEQDWGEEDEEGEDSSLIGAGGSRSTSAPVPIRRTSGARSWTKVDAIVFFLAVGVLGLSLWAIRWLALIGSA
jgi:predicted component of type VI protein secretion system